VGAERKDANWWLFSPGGRERGGKIRDNPREGTVEVNPDENGKKSLSYGTYLKLERLLSAQVPGSLASDERIFIIAHQLFELVFKQCIFDLGVIAEALRALLGENERDFADLAAVDGRSRPDERFEDFWRPALTASARLAHAGLGMVPQIMRYLASEETFNNEEFVRKFRDYVSPASAFQSAQFRLIQRALGKSRLLGIRLFPADTYLRAYEGKREDELLRFMRESENAGLVSVIDPLILREDAPVASPQAGSPLAAVAELDDRAHEALVRLAGDAQAEGECRVPLIPHDEPSIRDMEQRFTERLREALGTLKKMRNQPVTLTADERALIEKRGGIFRQDWDKAVREENRRRTTYAGACRGARSLYRSGSTSPLAVIFDRLLETDSALSEKFLLFHRNVVERRIGDVPGTAGGGVSYLDFSRSLIEYFPALAGLSGERKKAGQNP
jgi:tryptophan 2,3-dioxygenase